MHGRMGTPTATAEQEEWRSRLSKGFLSRVGMETSRRWKWPFYCGHCESRLSSLHWANFNDGVGGGVESAELAPFSAQFQPLFARPHGLRSLLSLLRHPPPSGRRTDPSSFEPTALYFSPLTAGRKAVTLERTPLEAHATSLANECRALYNDVLPAG